MGKPPSFSGAFPVSDSGRSGNSVGRRLNSPSPSLRRGGTGEGLLSQKGRVLRDAAFRLFGSYGVKRPLAPRLEGSVELRLGPLRPSPSPFSPDA
jgi:hypothetical protein